MCLYSISYIIYKSLYSDASYIFTKHNISSDDVPATSGVRKMGGACSTSGRDDAYETLVRKPEWKRRPRRRWEDIIRMDVREIEWEGVACMHLAQDRD